MQLAEAIQQLAGTKFLNVTTVALAEVVSVDVPGCTCKCKTLSGTTTADLITVSLMPEVEDGLLLVPEQGSTVIVGWNKELLPFIIMYSGLDSATFWVNNVITLKDGSLGGIPIVGVLVQALNDLQNKLNTLLTAYNTHTHVESGTITGPPSALVTGTVPVTTRAQIENTNVIHG